MNSFTMNLQETNVPIEDSTQSKEDRTSRYDWDRIDSELYLIRRGEREGRKIEASRDKVQFEVEKKNHAR